MSGPRLEGNSELSGEIELPITSPAEVDETTMQLIEMAIQEGGQEALDQFPPEIVERAMRNNSRLQELLDPERGRNAT